MSGEREIPVEHGGSGSQPRPGPPPFPERQLSHPWDYGVGGGGDSWWNRWAREMDNQFNYLANRPARGFPPPGASSGFPPMHPPMPPMPRFDGRDFGFDRQLSEVQDDREKFQVRLDVSQYKPEELEVKTQNNEVFINARHEERPDEHGFVSREFKRRYVLPPGTNAEEVTSSFSRDGFLTITAPKPPPPLAPGERRVPIEKH